MNIFKLNNNNNTLLTVITIVFSIITVILAININNPDVNKQFGFMPLILLLVFVIWHSTKRYGVKGILIFFVVAQVVSNILENLSISTGIPFGNYHYAQGNIPFIFQVPVTIGLAYFVYGYIAWIVGNILLGKADEYINSKANVVILPLTATFLMVMWDVVMDPINSTINHYWIWEDSGGFNGVPLTNYLGWFLTVYLFYQLFAIYLRYGANTVKKQVSKLFWLNPVIIYMLTGLSFVIMYVFIQPANVVDTMGQMWDKKNIYETAAIVSLYTMTFASFLAGTKIIRLQKEK